MAVAVRCAGLPRVQWGGEALRTMIREIDEACLRWVVGGGRGVGGKVRSVVGFV